MDPTDTQDGIEARTKTLCGGRVYLEVPEEAVLERYSIANGDPAGLDGVIKPYIILSFGTPYAAAGDRSIEGEDAQPHIQPSTGECWAANKRDSQRTANALVKAWVGYQPSSDSGPMKARSGRGFTQTDSQGRPTRSMTAVNAETLYNLSSAS